MKILLAGLLVASTAASGCASPGDASDGRAADIELPREMHVVTARVARGATLAALLRANDDDEAEVARLVERAQAVFDLRKVRADQPYRIEQAADGRLMRFEYEIDGDRVLRLSRPARAEDPFVSEIASIEKTRAVEIVRGRIDRASPSLFAAMDAEGETVDLPMALADIFGGEIDFDSELQPGDAFELAVEKQYRACGETPDPCAERFFAGYGPILAATFDNDGRRLRAVRFTPEGGQPGYFDEQGRSLKRFFLRSPLKFEPRVSSGFSRARMHPILREVRAHLGVDYKAPAGAPVIAVAAGVVVRAGVSGDSGRVVHLRHANGYESEYLHLSSIGVRAGTPVEQGELVGRVGASGLATGPHLDYRLKKNGRFINPLRAHRDMPPAEPIPAALMAAFSLARDRAFAALTAHAVATAAGGRAAAADHRH